MALVTVQRSPSPNASAEGDEGDIVDASESSLKSPRQRSFSENYFTVKGAALILPQSDFEAAYSRKPSKQHGGDEIQSHLQAMFSLLRPQDTIKVAVKLEGSHTRYLAVVSCIGRQDTEESILLGIDILDKADIGLIIPLWANTRLKLDGDGGFSIVASNNTHCFKPVSVQAMWSALQSLNKVVKIATDLRYLPRGLTHTWVGFYEAKQTKNSTFISEWNQSQDIDNSYRRDTSSTSRDMEEETLYRTIKTELKKVMMSVDLEEVTCLYLRQAVEEQMGMDLREHRSFINTEMLAILGQMDAPSKILDYLYLGSEWNASNLEELQTNGVQYILNISREIDNFFPGILHYYNVREWDVEVSNLQKYWDDTYKFINKARKRGSKTLVHCKMGISRSASTVIAFLMKEMRWSLQEAYDFCKSKRSIINPNTGFWTQLEEYEGILKANWNRDKFNRSNQPSRLSPTEEKDDVTSDMVQYGPEELQLMKLGLGASGHEGYMYTEQDIDIASRSADSTEDSLPDNFSPDTTKQRKSHHKKSDKHTTESSDFAGVSSDSSDYTDSEDLSSTDDEESDNDDNTGIFKPIEAVEAKNISSDEERKKSIKVETKRSKSESDKASVKVDDGMTLKVDDTGQAFSREGSQSRIKPDDCWIKPPSDSDVEGDTVETDLGDDDDGKEGHTENTEASNIGDTAEENVGINIKVHAPEEMEATSEGAEQVTDSDDQDQKDGDKDLDPYTRENIPWNPGMVRKQRDDIEGKKTSVATDKRDSSNDTEVMDTSRKSLDDTKHELKGPLVKPEIRLDLVGDTEEPMVCDVSEKSEEVPMDTSENKSDAEKARDSVYTREEIDLPEGIVRKTTQEIEERNKLLTTTPKKKIQRSSSMKTLRVTPKAKDRDNERRKTCIAILSPSHRSEPNLEVYNYDDTTLSGMDPSAMPLTDQGDSDALSFQASGDTEEQRKMSASTLKVYKFMGEELTVEEGLVRKQKMDIEQHAWKPKTEEEPVSHDHRMSTFSSVGTELSVNDKQADPTDCLISDSTADIYFDSVAQLEEKLIKQEDSDETGSIDCAHIQKVNVIKASLGEKGSCKQTEKEPYSSAQHLGKKQVSSNKESRFDRETLELIREIGSALLNSPAKPAAEQEEEELPQGKGLVSHFVKQIEQASGLSKKKAKREIIVIDKDTGPIRDSRKEGDLPKQGAQSSPKSCETIHKQCETFSGDYLSKRNSFSIPLGSDATCNLVQSPERHTSPHISPVSKSSRRKDAKTCSLHHEESGTIDLSDLSGHFGSILDGQTSNQLEEETSDVCSVGVKDYVKKFEQQDSCSGKSSPMFLLSPVSSNAHFFPGAKSDFEIMEVDRTSGATSDTFDPATHSPSHMTARLRHRRSEPVITMSDRSGHTLTPRHSDYSTSLSDQGVLSEESESADSVISEGAMSDITCERPRSAGQTQRMSRGRKFDSRRATLTYSHTMPHSETEDFTQDSRKVRKPYGRTHPLARLEDKAYMQNLRNNPFYNTM